MIQHARMVAKEKVCTKQACSRTRAERAQSFANNIFCKARDFLMRNGCWIFTMWVKLSEVCQCCWSFCCDWCRIQHLQSFPNIPQTSVPSESPQFWACAAQKAPMAS